MLELHQILEVDITEEMIFEARKDAEFLAGQIGKKTRAVLEDRDIIGSLAHQAVEQRFEEAGVMYYSTRTIKEKLGQGDKYDILYERDKIDVKGTRGTLDSKWFYRQQFLVFKDQLDADKFNEITHLLFVLVEPQLSRAYIFGVISTGQFLQEAYPVQLQYNNMAIRAKSLRPFFNYVYRTH